MNKRIFIVAVLLVFVFTVFTCALVTPVKAETFQDCGQFKITAYCGGHCCNGSWAGQSASGAPLIEGRTVAANHKDFPFGTVLVIDGKEYVVEDRGVRPGVIDIYFDSHFIADNFGIKYKKIYVKIP